MKERERIVVTGLVVLMLLLWLGFAIHQSPGFAGSLVGGIIGIAATMIMLAPLAYSGVKRIQWIRAAAKTKVSMRTLLSWHIYAGIAGPILALLHTGHRFESSLGIVLTTFMLTVVLSGFVGRYLMSQISREMRAKTEMLSQLELAYADLSKRVRASGVIPQAGLTERILSTFFTDRELVPTEGLFQRVEAVRLSESIADVEYAIKTHEVFKTWFARWLRLHIAISAVLYVLMIAHIGSEVYYGLRWLN